MINLETISDDEKVLLAEIAAAKGQTLEETLAALGQVQATAEEPVVLAAAEEEPKLVIELPVSIQAEAKHDASTLFEPTLPEVEPPPPPAADDDPEDEDKDAPTADTGAGSLKKICPNCGHDQDMPVIAEPDRQDKIGFLSCVLGQKLFSKKYVVFGGHLRLTFRTLTIREIDALYVQAYEAYGDKQVTTTPAYYEYMNRLRLFLQLTHMSAQQLPTQITLPDGLNQHTNPNARLHWDTFLKEQNLWDEKKPLLLQMEEYVQFQVLSTESLHRTVTHTCAKFNKLVARLECCVDDANFWEGIGPRF
jgi:hypothetical protein